LCAGLVVRVFVANDHAILRGALRAVIDMQPDMEVVGEAATGPDAELGIKETETDVVLMDLSIFERRGARRRCRGETNAF
jgi:DNA-binding NarL/FixJ family response regulator